MDKDTALRLALVEINRLCDTGKITGATIETIQSIKAALEAKDKQCRHRIADARNPVVKDGYLCVDCGALFSAADHAMPKQEAKDEPVAWLHRFIEGGISIGLKPLDLERHPERWEPLYTTPPQRTWVGLTDEEKQEIYKQADEENWHDQPLLETVEAKLKEKNT